MEISKHFPFALLTGFVLSVLIHAQDPSGFISLDCGLPKDSNYTDPDTGIVYLSDAAFIDTSKGMLLSPEFLTVVGIPKQLIYVRSFPQGKRNCYNMKLTRGNKYLIRETFKYGNYDGENKVLQFELHLGVNLWIIVKFENASSVVVREIIHVASLDYVLVCLVNIEYGTPFISALELRPLNNNIYDIVTHSGSLVTLSRLDIGSGTNQIVRSEDDVYDRGWRPYNYFEWAQLNTSITVDYQSNLYQPPSIVMSTAAIPRNPSEPLNLYFETASPIAELYVYMHFSELEKLGVNQSREFEIFLNGNPFYGPFAPGYLQTATIYNVSSLSRPGMNQFSIYKTRNSTLPPILNAIEVYAMTKLLRSQTNQQDVDAVMNIKSMYGITSNWQGDPCAPQDYVWDGLHCSYHGYDPPRIISLNLSSRGLTEEIPLYLSNLTSIQSLDLSHNSLTGPVPDFLSHLSSLSVLNLTGNNLTGSILTELIEKSEKGLLLLSVEGNANLYASISCKKGKKNKFVVPVVVSIGTSFLLITAMAIISIVKRKKKAANYKRTTATALLESETRQFTYSEVCRITNNFERVLGKGGFGTVYHGYLGDTQVAVKMLSLSSVQGYKQFQAEVKILLRVHHGNLTTLVGYCNDGTNNMAVIYEYLPNGNLKKHLSENRKNNSSWEVRIRVAVEAAQGLEYLHNGCKPPIVQRDVKSTNILLNDKFQAKPSDFGLSRTFPVEGGSHISTAVAGTPGYLDPEYHASGKLTEKSDVYSFGLFSWR